MKLNLENKIAPRMGAGEPFFTYERKVFLFLTVGAILGVRALLRQAKIDKAKGRR